MNVNVKNLSGVSGGQVIKANQTVEGDFMAVQCLTNCTFSTFDSNLANAVSNLGTVPAGATILGRIKKITISGGVAIAYNYA